MGNNEKLTAAFAEALNINTSLVKDSLAYQSIPQWDSVSHMVLISMLEQTFEVSIDTQDVLDMSSVSKAREILTRHGISF